MFTNLTFLKSKKSKKEIKSRSKSKKKKRKKSLVLPEISESKKYKSKKYKSKKSKTRKSKILPQILIQEKLDDDILNDIQELVLKNEKKYNISINQTKYLITLRIDKKTKKDINKKK